MTIKARLALAFVVLLLVATAAIGVVVVRSTRASLVDQIDNRLRETQDRPGPERGERGRGSPEEPETSAEDRFVAAAELIVSSSGDVVEEQAAGFTDEPLSLPKIPDDPSAFELDRIVTLSARNGEFDYRVLISE